MAEKTKVETYLSPALLQELRAREPAEGRPDHELIEEALAAYLSAGHTPELFEQMSRYRKLLGTTELSEEEAMELANAEVHAYREEHPEIYSKHANRSA